MEDEPINIIRESTRNLLKLNRRQHKDAESDARRSIKEIRITSENISEIANKLKKKSTCTVADLQTLKNGLMEDIKYIDTFLSVHGALRGLTRELTGNNVMKQCAAAGCCCNLALGDLRTCNALAKATGAYLVIFLDSMDVELAVTCAWTLGNIAGAGLKTCNILAAQGALFKLSDIHNNEDLQDAALYALTHFAYQMKDELKPEHLKRIIETLSKLKISDSSAYILFLVSYHKNFMENVNEELLQKILQNLNSAIELHKACVKKVDCCKLVYLLGILANMCGMYEIILNYFITNNMFYVFKGLLNLNNEHVNKFLLWLMGNLYNCSGDDNLFLQLIS